MDEQNVTTTEEQEAQAQEPQEEQKEAIPDELAGLSEDTAREIMEQAHADDSHDEKEEEQAEEEAPDAEKQDSENKTDDKELDVPKTNIPYARFKQEVDKRRQLEEQIAALKAQVEANAQPPKAPQATPTPPAPQPQAPQVPQFQFTPEVQKAFDAEVKKQALAMTGMKDDDVESLEYMDDDDPRKTRYATAKKFAEAALTGKIIAAQQEQQRRAQQFLAIHQQNIDGYNQFASKEMREPDFEQTKAFATGDYFESLPANQQPVIAAAYSRIERQTANDADIMLIQDYFTKAKTAYRQKHPLAAPRKTNTKQKMKQAVSMPRAGQVGGTSGYDGAVTGETLAEMMRTTPWEEIPEQYRNMILSAKTN